MILKAILARTVILRERVLRANEGPERATAPFAARSAANNKRDASILIALVVLLASFASAQTLTGTVKDSTTGKLSAGDDVVMFKLGQGMEESGRTKTDAKGQFSFKLDDAQAPHLIRAIHQDVTYHRMAPPGTTSVAIEVYDAAKKVDGIEVVADIMRIQAEQGQILVTREFGVQNTSNPQRTHSHHRRRQPAEVRSRARRREESLLIHLPSTAGTDALRSELPTSLQWQRESGSQVDLPLGALRSHAAEGDAVQRCDFGRFQID